VIPPFPVYVFDIDGTLVDSLEDICGTVIDVLKATPCRPLTVQELRPYIGVHLAEMFRDLLPEYNDEQQDGLIREYRRLYPLRRHRSTTVFPGVREALAALPGRKATATTKGTATARAVLEQFGLAPQFDHVQGTDGFPYKPAPDVILAALRALNATPAECLMVGDSAADMEAGRRAGVKTCAVRYGYGVPAEMARFEPDYWVDDLRQLLA
jgi:HAD superfamily hydrolase (TIGR01509 family)